MHDHDESAAMRERMQAAYDTIAAEYASRQAGIPPKVLEIGKRFLSSLAPGARILDVGCGPGRDMAWMESQGFHLTGVDLSPGMLAQARPHVQGELLQMDMRNLSFPDASFDGIWCSASLLHLPKTEAPLALQQMRRVLVPGGLLFLGVQEGTSEGWEAGRFENVERFFARYTLEEAEALLSRNGFALIASYPDTTTPRLWLDFLARALPPA